MILPDPLPDTEAIRLGRDLEEFLLRRYAKARDLKIRRNVYAVCKEAPLFSATYDALVVGENEALEAKTANLAGYEINPEHMRAWGIDGTDQIPMTYLVQGLMQIKVKNLDAVHYPTMLGGVQRPFRDYHITPDWLLIDEFCKRLMEWWDTHIIRRVPPDGSIGKLYGDRIIRKPGKIVNIDPDLLVAYKEAGGQESAAKKEKARLRAKILGSMLDAEMGAADGVGYAQVKKIPVAEKMHAGYEQTKVTVKIFGRRTIESDDDSE